MISDAVLDQMLLDGCTAVQIINAIKADRADVRAKRAARAAARAVRLADGNADKPGPVESVLPVMLPATGGLRKDQARRGLGAARGLSPAAKDVGQHIVDRCALAVGSYAVGVTKLAERLGLSGRSVRRALADLDAAGLIAREIHGGRHHVNAYRPNWDALARLGVVRSVPANPDSEAKPGLNRPNLSAKTESPSPTLSSPRKSQREPDRRQREMMLPVVVQGGRAGAPQGAIAREQAELRLGVAYRTHLHKLGEAAGREFKGSVTAEDWEAGVVAEMAKRGSGLQAMLDSGFARWSAETKPPSAATG